MRNFISLFTVFIISLFMIGCSSGDEKESADSVDVTEDQVTEGTAADTTGQDTVAQNDIGQETLTPEEQYLISDNHAGQVDKSLVAANTAFAVKMFKKLNEAGGPGQNLFISPLSISTALAMTYNGATGETKQAMAETLEYEGIDIEMLNSSYLNLIKSLENADIDVTLAIADSIWMDDEFEPAVNDAFLETMVTYYESELFTVDFQAPETLDEVNGWIEDNTNGKIKDMLDQIPAAAVMYLINALYFKADWTYPFDPQDTQKEDFTLADGTKRQVDMMKFPEMVSSFQFTADQHYCVVRLPYGRDKVAFYGFIPYGYEDEKTVEDFIGEMTAAKLTQYIANVQYPEGEGAGIRIHMPRFKIEYKKTLNDELTALGMGPAFGGGFDNIAPGIFISRVIHQTFVEVNEEGTEAAAATVVEMQYGIPPAFIGNKPFFFVIRDDRSGAILFMGKLADPATD